MLNEELNNLKNLKGQISSISSLPTGIISAPFSGLIVSQLKNLLGLEDLIRGLIRKILQNLDICELLNQLPLEEVEKTIKKIISLRNDVIDFINQILQIISSLLSITSIIQTLITVFKLILDLIPIITLAIPSAVPPGIGLPVGLGVTFSSLLAMAKNFITSVESILNVLNTGLIFLSEQLSKIIDILSSITIDLFQCVDKLNETQLNQDNNFLILKEKIRKSSNQEDIIQLNNQLNNIINENFNRLIGTLSPIPNVNLGIQSEEYKGFTFSIKTKNTIEGTPQQYAVALDVRKIQVLEGRPSFASDTKVLIQELKTIIDRQNLSGF